MKCVDNRKHVPAFFFPDSSGLHAVVVVASLSQGLEVIGPLLSMSEEATEALIRLSTAAPSTKPLAQLLGLLQTEWLRSLNVARVGACGVGLLYYAVEHAVREAMLAVTTT